MGFSPPSRTTTPPSHPPVSPSHPPPSRRPPLFLISSLRPGSAPPSPLRAHFTPASPSEELFGGLFPCLGGGGGLRSLWRLIRVLLVPLMDALLPRHRGILAPVHQTGDGGCGLSQETRRDWEQPQLIRFGKQSAWRRPPRGGVWGRRRFTTLWNRQLWLKRVFWTWTPVRAE